MARKNIPDLPFLLQTELTAITPDMSPIEAANIANQLRAFYKHHYDGDYALERDTHGYDYEAVIELEEILAANSENRPVNEDLVYSFKDESWRNTLVSKPYAEESLGAIRRLCGYVENGSSTTAAIFQDDATRDWHIRIGENTLHRRAKYLSDSSFSGVLHKAVMLCREDVARERADDKVMLRNSLAEKKAKRPSP